MEDLRTTRDESVRQEVLAMDEDEKMSLLRGLGRTTVVGRHEDGSAAITQEGLRVQEIVRQSQERLVEGV